MIIVMNKETLYRNIINDGKKGSGAGDIILNQNINNVKANEYQISDFDCIPNDLNLINHESLKSKKDPNSEVYRVFVFDKFEVNGEPLDFVDNKFIIFIRKTGTKGKEKIRLNCQGSNRSIKGTSINNKLVLDAVSNHLDNVAFTVEAFEYNEQKKALNFIVFTYGKDNQASQIFKKRIGVDRKLSGYGTNDFSSWNDIEFSLHCIQLIRKYNLNNIITLLKDKMYCKRRFNMNLSFLNKDVSEERLSKSVKISDEDLYVLTKLSDKTKYVFWEFLLDRIQAISEDVIIDSNEYELKVLRIPDEIIIQHDIDTIEIPFKVDGNDYRNYFYSQGIFQGDNVLLVSNDIDAVKIKYLYKVRFIKEESIICDKCEIMINQMYESQILEELRGKL